MMRQAIAAIVAMSATCTFALAADSTKILSPAARAITASGEKPYDKPFNTMPSLTSDTKDGGEHGEVAPDPEHSGGSHAVTARIVSAQECGCGGPWSAASCAYDAGFLYEFTDPDSHLILRAGF